MKTVVVSLFAGMGGFDLAGDCMGWESSVICEIDPLCQVVLKHHFPDAYLHGDIKTLTGSKINEEIEKRYGNRDSVRVVLCGGFPCQPYSAAGKRLGKEDDRHLWPEMLRVIRECKPDAVVGENVSGIVSWSGGLVFEEVQADLEAEGYEVQAVILPACGVGAPHRRDRVWFIADCSGELQQRNDNGIGRNAGRENVLEENGETASIESATVGKIRLTPNSKSQRCRKKGASLDSSEQRSRGTGGKRIAADATKPGRKERVKAHGCKVSKETRTGMDDGLERFGGVRVACESDDFNGDISGLCASEVSQLGASGVRKYFAPDPDGKRLRRQGDRQGKPRHLGETGPGNFWQNFPTESPLCNGNDGVPPGLGKLGFVVGGKKLTRSMLNKAGLKMGGNAIVPQVALQIFRALQNTWK